MEAPVVENSEQPRAISSNVTDHEQDNCVSDVSNHGYMPPALNSPYDFIRGLDSKHETAQEVRSIIEVIAATGKFWHDWDQLKSMLSFHLKQVLSEYPEAKMTSDLQNSSLGETYPELVKRLDDALHSFAEGPPFTLQRLCEILLAARSMYPNLSKLALALEKNLTVTSTLTICTDPYPAAVNQSNKESEEPPQLESTNPVQNGNEPPMAGGDRDEIMAEVEEAADVNDDMTIDMETFEDIVRSSEANTVPTVGSNS